MDDLGAIFFRLLKSSVFLRSLIDFFRFKIVAIFFLVCDFLRSFLISVGTVFRFDLVRCGEVSSSSSVILCFRRLICVGRISSSDSSSSKTISCSMGDSLVRPMKIFVGLVVSERSSVFISLFGSKFCMFVSGSMLYSAPISGSVFWRGGAWRHYGSWVGEGVELFGDSDIKSSSSGKLRSWKEIVVSGFVVYKVV